MLKKSAFFLLFLLKIIFPTLSQKTYWASKVLEFSSERVIPFQTTEYKAVQVLGKPNIFPNHVVSTVAWEPFSVDNPNEEYITVGFDTLISIRQVVVAENFGNGCITKIIALDTESNPHILYNTDNEPSKSLSKGKMLHIYLPENTAYGVVAIKLIWFSDSFCGVINFS